MVISFIINQTEINKTVGHSQGQTLNSPFLPKRDTMQTGYRIRTFKRSLIINFAKLGLNCKYYKRKPKNLTFPENHNKIQKKYKPVCVYYEWEP